MAVWGEKAPSLRATIRDVKLKKEGRSLHETREKRKDASQLPKKIIEAGDTPEAEQNDRKARARHRRRKQPMGPGYQAHLRERWTREHNLGALRETKKIEQKQQIGPAPPKSKETDESLLDSGQNIINRDEENAGTKETKDRTPARDQTLHLRGAEKDHGPYHQRREETREPHV